MSTKKKETIKWSSLAGVILVLWLTGWHAPVIAKVQQLVLSTGLVQANINYENVSDLPIDATFIDENGNKVELKSLRGKVVFLNIWATWCPPCKAEMPSIQNLYDRVDQDKISFIMFTTDESFEKAKQYKKNSGYTFPIHQLGANLPIELHSNAIPTTFVLDKEGKIQMKQMGMAKYDSDKFIDFIEKLAN